jgi:hypothetical protein
LTITIRCRNPQHGVRKARPPTGRGPFTPVLPLLLRPSERGRKATRTSGQSAQKSSLDIGPQGRVLAGTSQPVRSVELLDHLRGHADNHQDFRPVRFLAGTVLGASAQVSGACPCTSFARTATTPSRS